MTDAELYAKRGEDYHCEGKFVEAEANFLKALELEPDNLIYNINYGNNLQWQGDYEKAIVYQSRAIEIKPDYPEAYYCLGVTYAEMGDDENAKVNYEEAARLDPCNEHYTKLLERVDVALLLGVEFLNKRLSEDELAPLYNSISDCRQNLHDKYGIELPQVRICGNDYIIKKYNMEDNEALIRYNGKIKWRGQVDFNSPTKCFKEIIKSLYNVLLSNRIKD